MNYARLSNEELKQFPYPNLIAEWRESGYSVCTLGDHMGLGRYREENDPVIMAKLRGDDKVTTEEAIGLAELFGTKLEYLFSHELKTMNGESMAYWRWYDRNKRKEEELKQIRMREEIMRNLREKPYLLEIFTELMKMSQKQLYELTYGQAVGM